MKDMIGTYIVLFLMAVGAGAIGGFIAHVIYGKIQERKLRNWKPKKKEPHWVTYSETNC